MKKIYSLLLLFSALLIPIEAWSDGINWDYKFTVDGIKYAQNGKEREVKHETWGGGYYTVIVPEVEVIGLEDESYEGGVIIPESVGYWTKDGSTYLESPVIGIAYNAFNRCVGLTSVVFPNTIEYIDKKAFHNCIRLYDIVIPNSVITIGDEAFAYCGNLRKTLIIGSGVKQIGNKAFYGTYSTYNNYCYAENVPETGSNLFCDDIEEILGNKLYVPKASVNAYKTVEPWKYFDVIGFTYINPIEGETIVNTSNLGGQNLTDNVVDDVYYNVGADGYDTSDGSIVIGETTNMAQIENPIPGTDGVKNNFTGLILKVAAGKGTITVNAKTTGNAQLVVQVGNQTPMIATKTEQGDVIVGYDVTEDTYIYIYAIIGSSAAPAHRVASDNVVKNYGFTVSPGATGVNEIDNGQLTMDNYYTLDGRKLDGVPAKEGIYIVNGKKMVMK